MDSLELAQLVSCALASKKGQNIVILEIKGLTVIADYFVIATGSSSLNINALCDAVLDETRKTGIKGVHPQGKSDTWVLLDLHDVVVHIFDEDHRDFYQLDRLWVDAPIIPLPEGAK